jgi:hypothetical protein
MPFKSEKQRRYLWANEPEIARDWTDTYGSGIHKALGGRIPFRRGGNPHSDAGGRTSRGMDMSGASNRGGRSTPSHSPDRGGPINPHADTAPVIQQQRQTDFRNLINQQNRERRDPPQRVGPKLGSGIGGGLKNFLGNWGSTVGGSQLGGGLGSMLLGPWGLLLGSIFGGGAGRRAWKASQTDEKETIKDILFGNPNTKSTLLSNLFNKKKPPTTTGEGLGAIDLSNMDYDKRHFKYPSQKSYSEFDTIPVDKYKGLNVQRNYMGQPIQSDLVQEAKLFDLALNQMRVLERKKAYQDYGGEKFTPQDQQLLDRLKEMDKEEEHYHLPIV